MSYMFSRKNIILFFILFFGLLGLGINSAQAGAVSSPTIIDVGEKGFPDETKPLIMGLTPDRTLVHIYIDGAYNGKTEKLLSESGSADFTYRSFLDLSRGEHTVWAIAEDEDGQKSGPSNIFKFKIRESVSAPTLFTPIVNNDTVYNRPFIVGLSKNDLIIKIYIDHKLNGEFRAGSNESGAVSFVYKPSQNLAGGPRLIYATATDNQGRESSWSNIVYFKAASPDMAAPAAEEGGEIKDQEEAETREEAVEDVSPETGAGLIDESEEKQDKLPLNLIIFIIFFVSVIGWIIWVNRELIKEKRNQSKKNDPPKDV